MRRKRLERRLVWIFGSPRSGSTWLMNLLQEGGCETINEPLIGPHVAPLSRDLDGPVEHLRLNTLRADTANYFFSERYRDTWEPMLRRLILERLAAQVSGGNPIVIKEPNGSEAADVILAVLPQSRMIFLVRDGRDVVDSEIDAHAWTRKHFSGGPPSVEHRARTWVVRMEIAGRAFAAHHPDRRRLVRYEDLLANPTKMVGDLWRWLGLRGDVDAAVERQSFERIQGPGHFARAASPGLWRTNRTPEEQGTMQAVMGEKLHDLGYHDQ